MDRRRFLFLTAGTATGLLYAGGEFIALPQQMVLAMGGGCSFCHRHVSILSVLAAVTGRNARVCQDCVAFFLGIGTSKPAATNEGAARAIARGDYDAATRELIADVARTPEDVRTRLKLGDLFAKQNHIEQAAREYEFVAEAYMKEGFLLKAVAVSKQVARIAGENPAILFRLGDLYEMLGLLSDAARSFQTAFQLSPAHSVEALAAAHGIPVAWRSQEFWIALRHTMGARTPLAPGACGFCDAVPPEHDLFHVTTSAICRDCTTKAQDLLASRTVLA